MMTPQIAEASSWPTTRPGIRPDADAIPMMIDMDDPAHLRRRKLVTKGFTQRVRDREDEVRSVCDEIIDRVIERGECEFVWDIALPCR